jgi:hypothetical protein
MEKNLSPKEIYKIYDEIKFEYKILMKQKDEEDTFVVVNCPVQIKTIELEEDEESDFIVADGSLEVNIKRK